MLNRDALHKQLDMFLDEKPKSNGEWETISPTIKIQLDDLFYDIVAFRFNADVDGDLPIKVHVEDRDLQFSAYPVVIDKVNSMRKLRQLYRMQQSILNEISDTLENLPIK